MITTRLDSIYEKLVKKYKTVAIHEIDDEIYMYTILTKLEYETLLDQYPDELDLQDAIVENCVKYPDDLIVEEMLPGDVFELAEVIVNQSYILPNDRLLMLDVFSSQMAYMDNIICCLIMRAFPSYKLEELDNMTYPELYKLYTRAEWYLINVAQEPLLFSARDSIIANLEGGSSEGHSDYYSNGHDEENGEEQIDDKPVEENVGKYMGRNLSEVMSEINNSGSRRKPMTEEQRIELERFKQQFPDIDMNQDAMYTGVMSETAGVVRDAPRKKF